ncbi:MAG: hypothetical protein KJP02_01145 [Octadecabacter sp.]|nr:hypothetical protein [Octadecabacter sp.]
MTRPPDPDWAPQLRFTLRFWVGCAVVLLSVSFLLVAALALRDARALNARGVPVRP